MTVPYMKQIAECNVYTFLKLLFRWRGSVWKSIYLELCCYMLCYHILNMVYHTFMVPNMSGPIFEVMVRHLNDLLPVMFTTVIFAMGFYVTQIYNRWWAVFMMLPWPDTFCFEIIAYVRDRPGKQHRKEDENARKTMARHLNLAFVLVFRGISERVKTRFPTLRHLVGTLLTENEKNVLDAEPSDAIQERVYWIPIEWISNLLKRHYYSGQIDDIHYSRMLSTLLDFRERLHNVMQYDIVNLPLIYTQVVHLVTYAYFAIQLVASQKPYSYQKYWYEVLPIPGYALCEFIFLVGWLKAAEVMINPFGMDDDDFDIDIIIERNLLVSYSAVGNLFEEAPELRAEDMEFLLEASKSDTQVDESNKPKNVLMPSAAAVEVPDAEQAQVTIIRDVEKQVKVIPQPPKEDTCSVTAEKPTPEKLTEEKATTEKATAERPTPSKKEARASQKKQLPQKKKNTNKDKPSKRQQTSADRASRLDTPHASRAEDLELSTKAKEAADPAKIAEQLEQLEKIEKEVLRKRNKLQQRGGEEEQKSRTKLLGVPATSKQASTQASIAEDPTPGSSMPVQMSVEKTPPSLSMTQRSEVPRKKAVSKKSKKENNSKM